MSITKYVDINEGRTARLKCYTLNVPNVTVSTTKDNNLNMCKVILIVQLLVISVYFSANSRLDIRQEVKELI